MQKIKTPANMQELSLTKPPLAKGYFFLISFVFSVVHEGGKHFAPSLPDKID